MWPFRLARKAETFLSPRCLTGRRIKMLLRVRPCKALLTFTGALMLCAGTLNLAVAQEPDNTSANKDGGKTADQQKENKNDREITRQIRKALVADKALSTYAHNVKVISENGTVTLRGPVRSEDEKSSIEAKAKAVAGVNDVKNELAVVAKGG